jgi:hypothetical protein
MVPLGGRDVHAAIILMRPRPADPCRLLAHDGTVANGAAARAGSTASVGASRVTMRAFVQYMLPVLGHDVRELHVDLSRALVRSGVRLAALLPHVATVLGHVHVGLYKYEYWPITN